MPKDKLCLLNTINYALKHSSKATLILSFKYDLITFYKQKYIFLNDEKLTGERTGSDFSGLNDEKLTGERTGVRFQWPQMLRFAIAPKPENQQLVNFQTGNITLRGG